VAASHLQCRSCQKEYPLGLHYLCACGGILNVIYDLEDSRLRREAEKALLGFPGGPMWRFGALLPVRDTNNIITLGEGGTPLIAAPRLGGAIGLPKLFLKNESANPTASFKDRPTSVGVSVAREFGAERIIIASSGNAGAAAGTYSARAGLPCIVVVPQGTPAGKVAQAQSCGARVVYTEGSYSNAFKLALAAAQTYGWANVSSTFLNPYTVEGDKTVAYEIWQQLGRKVPDWVIVPIGAGPLLVGTLKGFEELRLFGLTDRVPAMVGVQAEGVHPVASAFAAGETEVTAWMQKVRTISTGIADPLVGYPQDGTLTLDAIRSSGGSCLAAPDRETVAMGERLARTEGLFVEPTAATGLHAAALMAEQGLMKPEQTVVALMTAHGLKTPNTYLPEGLTIPVVGDMETLISLFDR
jgi:threonine synthase